MTVYIHGDGFLGKALKQAHLQSADDVDVIACGGTPAQFEANPSEIVRDTQTAERIARAAKGRVIYLTTTMAYVAADPLGRRLYAAVKAHNENRLQELLGPRLTVVRLPRVYDGRTRHQQAQGPNMSLADFILTVAAYIACSTLASA